MDQHDVVIIGTGFSGMGLAMKLRDAGRDDFVVLEKADDVGGTWRDNTYPGCECDIPSHMYSFSYELNPRWSKDFSRQPEIHAYMRDVADRHDLRRHVRFGTEVTGASWDEGRQRWTVDTRGGETYEARVLVSGAGGLHIPNVPPIEGADTFAGPRFHSAQWQHDVDLTGKRVAVIGTGASAVQFVPIIADQVSAMTVFQRTAPWVLPKKDRPRPEWQKQVFEKVPGAQRAYRDLLYWGLEARAIAFNGHVMGLLKVAENVVTRYLDKAIDDPGTAHALRPDYRLGCKRVLQSNTYYPTFNRDHVTLETTGIARIVPEGVVTVDGTLHEADVIVYGTGFHVTDAFRYWNMQGRDGVDLGKQFDEHGIETYLGIMTHRFPNLFFMLGPNTALGHNSVVFMIEQQTKWIVRALEAMDARGAAAIEPTEQAQEAFNTEVQRLVSQGIWTQGGCTSWYLDSQGRNRTIWPKFTFQYWWETRRLKGEDFAFTPARDRETQAA